MAMTTLLVQLGVVLVLLSLAYAVMGLALHLRRQRHGAGPTCASVQSRDGVVHGCVCRDKGEEAGSFRNKSTAEDQPSS